MGACDKADFKQKLIRRYTEGHYFIKGTIENEEITMSDGRGQLKHNS